MRTGLVIADFDSRFTTSFKHTAQVKYNVVFASSNITHIKEQLKQLKANWRNGNINNVHVGYDFSLQDVERIETLLDTLIIRYTEAFGTDSPPDKKIYTLMQQLKETNTPTPEEYSKEVLKEILTPPQPKKLSRKDQLKVDAEAKTKERMLDLMRKHNAKKGKN